MSVDHAIIDRERAFWEAAGNAGSYDEAFADDGVMAFHVGIMRKPEVLAAIGGSESWASYSIDDPQIVEISDSVASHRLRTTERLRPTTGCRRPP